jgi:N-methylhydantoinase A
MSDVVRDYSRTVMIPTTAQEEKTQVFSANSAELQQTLRLEALNGSGHKEDAEFTENSSLHPHVLSLLEPFFSELESKAAAEFRDEGLAGVAIRSCDLRYAGQGYELNVPAGPEMLADFHTAHAKRYGHADNTRTVEVVNVRVRMIAASEKIEFLRQMQGAPGCKSAVIKRKRVMFDGTWLDAPVYQRDLLAAGNMFQGPAIVHEYSATTVVPPGFEAKVDEHLNILIEV